MTELKTVAVLIVEDFAPIRQRLQSMLAGTPGVEVVGQTGDGDEALRLFSHCRPDAVILDIQMPGASGIEVLRAIKSMSPQCLVIMLTSHGAEEYREACLRSGADHFFQKATEFERILETLDALRRG